MWIGLIVSPLLLLGLILLTLLGGDSTEKAAVDPNQRIQELQREADGIAAEVRDYFRLVRAEDPSVEARGAKLRKKLDRWMEEWDGIFEPQRDADGNLPPGLQAYQRARSKVNQSRIDFVKSSGF